MFLTKMNAILAILAILIILLSGCSATPAVSIAPPSQTGTRPAGQPVAPPAAEPPVQQNVPASSGNITATMPVTVQTPPVLQNRIEIIYSHMNQRCPTCLCFEERINTVIEKYFSEQISSGRLTYKVLNAQEPQNAAFAGKYRAVGSQLFINTVVNGFDNIEDIQDIWNWDCRNNRPGFDLKVKNVIEQRLSGIR